MIYKQSAVLPFRRNGKGLDVLLITSKKNNWIIPKGLIEPGMSPQESALKESEEEAGAKGKVLDKIIGEYNYKKWGGTCNVKVYPMAVNKMMNSWEEDSFRKREWFSISKASKKVNKKDLARIIKALPFYLEKA